MGAVRKNVVLHPTTVQKIANNAIMVSKPKRKTTRPRTSPVKRKHYLDGVDPLIVAWIRENKIYYKRVEVINSETVIIHN